MSSKSNCAPDAITGAADSGALTFNVSGVVNTVAWPTASQFELNDQAGDKAGRWKERYGEAIPLAEQRYERYLKERVQEEEQRR